MDFNKEFSDIYYECQCAGAAGGANCISSFAPENNKGVVDIHEKDKDLKESKIREAFDFEDDDDLGYDDFDYEGEMEDYYNPRENWPENDMEQMWANEDDALIADSGIPVVKSNIFGKDTDNLSDEYMDMLDVDLGVEKAVDHSSVYDYDKIEPSEIAIDPRLLGESTKMNFKKIYQKSLNENMEDDNWDEPYEGEIEDTRAHNEDWYWELDQKKRDWLADTKERDVADTMPTRNFRGKMTKNFKDLKDFESDFWNDTNDDENYYRYHYKKDYDNPKPIETAIDPKLLGESKVMPRSIRESRALIGGSLESKEKTDYENTLEEHNKKRSYNKTVDSIDQKLTGVDSGAHGKHEWTGELKNE